MTKKYRLPKLALGIIGYLITAIIIAIFSFNFLYMTSRSLIERVSAEEIELELLYGLVLICVLAAITVFFAFFLLFLGRKIGYILDINKGVQRLRGGNLGFRLECQGGDELSELADTINSFADTIEHYRANEENLKMEKEALIHSLSHDIRTPLTVIISYADFIKNKQYDREEKLESYILTIQNKAYQIQELTDLLLNAGKNQEKTLEEVALEGKLLFEQFVMEFEEGLEDRGFQIQANMAELSNFKTRINVQDMTRIFDNLYSNVIKYADPKEIVRVDIFLKNDYLTIYQTNKIKEVTPQEFQSYGIGLKSVKQIISKYDGEMNITSDPKNYKIEIKFRV